MGDYEFLRASHYGITPGASAERDRPATASSNTALMLKRPSRVTSYGESNVFSGTRGKQRRGHSGRDRIAATERNEGVGGPHGFRFEPTVQLVASVQFAQGCSLAAATRTPGSHVRDTIAASMTDAELIAGYLAHATTTTRDGTDAEHFEASEELDDLVTDAPERAWALLCEIIRRISSE